MRDKRLIHKGSGRTRRSMDEASGDVNNVVFPPTSTIILTQAQLDKINEESEIIRRYFWKHRKDHLKSTNDTRWD